MSTSPNVGLFTWYELLTRDVEAAKAFYGAVVGWGTQPFDGPMEYTMWTAGEVPVGGLMSLAAAQQPDRAPYWIGTVSVADIDATVAKVTALGGAVHAPVHEIPGVGRFAVVADPTGAAFSLLQSADPGGPPERTALGRFSWHELWTSDPDAAWAFYRELFGWVETGTMDMGPEGTYRMFGRAGENSIGGIARKAPEGPPSSWLFYTNVANADAAGEKAKGLGATIFMGPMDVPGGGRITGGMDPQGAGFAVYAHVG